MLRIQAICALPLAETSRRLARRSLLTWAAGCCVVLAISPPARSLDPSTALPSYARQTWVMENGLPQNTVTALLQTQDGFLWLGTEAGLVRFDGSGFQVFDHNSDANIPGNDICCLLEGPDGSLWVGTSEGLARRQQGKFKTYSIRDGLPSNGIRALARYGDGHFVVITDQGSALLDGDKFGKAVWGSATVGDKFPSVAASSGAYWSDTPRTAEAATALWKRIG